MLSLIVFLIGIKCFAQNSILGVPQISNFEKEDYEGSAQNWETLSAFDQVFFANNSGLFNYDGSAWKSHSMNGAIMRSMSYDNKNRIYCAGQNELGYFQPNKSGQFIYSSLRDSIKIKDENLGEIWDINIYRDTLWFSSEHNIITYKDGNSSVRSFSNEIKLLTRVNEHLWIQVENEGLYRSDRGEIFPIKGGDLFKDKLVVGILTGFEGGLLIITSDHGIYKYSDNYFEKISLVSEEISKNLSAGAFHRDHGLFLASSIHGVYGLDKDFKCYTKLDRTSGLQHNSINCLGFTRDGDLWIGANNGIDYVSLVSNKSIFHPDDELEGTIFDIAKWNGQIYVSSSTGLYTIKDKTYYNPLEDQKFELVDGTGGQNWGIDVIDDQLYCAHHEEALIVKRNNQTEKIPNVNGTWKFVKLSDNKIAIGHYSGVNIYTVVGDKLRFDYKVPGLNETSRVMTFDLHKNLWVSHPYNFVYRISFADNFESAKVHKYDADKGFVTNDNNYVYGINGACYLTNTTGAYRYDHLKDVFVSADELNQLFEPNTHIRSLIQLNDEVWCITDKAISRLKIVLDGLNIKFEKTDFNDVRTDDNFVGGFENLFRYNDEKLFFCSDKGVIEYSLEGRKKSPLKSRINKIQLTTISDSIIYGGYGPITDVVLQPKYNAFTLDYGSNRLNPNERIQYAIQLDGLENEWSPWTEVQVKEYNNLPYGAYTLKIKARDIYGQESETTSINIEVQTPWYKSKFAFILFSLLFILSFASILLFQKRRFNSKAARLESEIERTEEEMEIIKQEKLEEQIRFKNKELALTTMNLLQKDETLNAIRTEIEIVERRIKDSQARKEIRKIISLLRSDDRLQEDWDNFSLHFDQVHHDFIKRLRTKYSNLTPKDQKLCAYLRMNLTTKEIAPLLRISVRGIEISRYRLRKKLGLGNDVNLNTFMMDF